MAESADDKAQGTPVGYRAGIEFGIMAPNGQGGVAYHLGKADGLSKTYHWTKAAGMVQLMPDADADVMRAHVAAGRLRSYPRTDFITGEDTGISDPEFLVGQAAIDTHRREFTKRYKEYAKAAAELAASPSIDVEQIPS